MRMALALLVLGFLLTGCAVNQQTMSRDEFLSTTQRSYEGVTEREFYQAAERVFKLSDEDDTQFSYPGEHAMIAQRAWSIYMVLAYGQGVHTWQIQTEPGEDGLTATSYVSMQSGTVTGVPTGGGGASTVTAPAMQNMVNTPAIYELFWSRMDYLLGEAEEWPTCDDWGAKIDRGETYGNLEPLCLAMNTDDLLPEDLR